MATSNSAPIYTSLTDVTPIRDIEKRFANLGKDVGNHELSGKLGPEPLPSSKVR